MLYFFWKNRPSLPVQIVELVAIIFGMRVSDFAIRFGLLGRAAAFCFGCVFVCSIASGIVKLILWAWPDPISGKREEAMSI